MTIGDIGSVIDSLEFDAEKADMPSVCHVSGDIYAIAYFGHLSDGWICTFEVSSLGVMPATIKDSWEFDTNFGSYPKIIKIYNTVYAIVYTDVAVNGILLTFNIANDGTITKSTLASTQFSAASANPHHLVKIDDNVFAVIFTDGDADGWIQTMGIANDGTITNSDLSKLEFDTALGKEGFLCHVADDVYAIAYRGPGDDGWLCTVKITDAGVITATVIDTLEFDLGTCVEPSMVKARNNYFAIAYSGPGADGWLKIIHIADNGTITDPAVDSYEFDVSMGQYPWLYAMGQGYIALTYTRSANQLWAATFLVDATGHLNSTTLDTKVIDDLPCTYSDLINLAGNYFVLIYAGPDFDGWIKTFTIDCPAAPGGQHHLMTGML